jgi:hypothetical protein
MAYDYMNSIQCYSKSFSFAKVPNFGWKNMFSEVFFSEKVRKNSEGSPQKQKLLPLGGSNILL